MELLGRRRGKPPDRPNPLEKAKILIHQASIFNTKDDTNTITSKAVQMATRRTNRFNVETTIHKPIVCTPQEWFGMDTEHSLYSYSHRDDKNYTLLNGHNTLELNQYH